MTDGTNGNLDPEALSALRQLARSRPRSGRGQAARLGAVRVLERISREQEQATPPDERSFPWERPGCDVVATFQIYGSSTIERLIFGSLSYPPTSPRPVEEQQRIAGIFAEIESADDPRREFRRWYQEAAARGDLAS